jgi:hypothetical protein
MPSCLLLSYLEAAQVAGRVPEAEKDRIPKLPSGQSVVPCP